MAVRVLLPALLLFAATFTLADAPARLAKDLRWGEPANGLAVNLEIHDRETYAYHLGERFQFLARIKNTADKPIQFPQTASQYVQYFVRLPDGAVYVLGDSDHPVPHKNILQAFDPRVAWHLDSRFEYFADNRRDWRITKPDQAGIDPHASFRKPGDYEFWAVLTIPKSPDHNGWSGTLTSNTVKVNLTDLALNNRRKAMSPEQIRDVDLLIKGQLQNTDSLTRDIRRTENEPLALRLVEQIPNTKEDEIRRGIFYILSERALAHGAARNIELAIDGPYFKKLAELLMKEMERYDPAQPTFIWEYRDSQVVALYLRHNQSDRKLSDRANAFGQKHAKVADHLEPPQWVQLEWSWTLLRATGQLKTGMPLADATNLLGEPSYSQARAVGWNYNPGSRVIQGLQGRLEDDKVFFDSFRE